MRKWAYLDKPYEYDGRLIFKVMLYETEKDGTYVFLYDSPEAQICAADEWYESLMAAEAAWEGCAKRNQWNITDDPLPNCQADCILPIRVKGRDTDNPEWGVYERLIDGRWVEYKK